MARMVAKQDGGKPVGSQVLHKELQKLRKPENRKGENIGISRSSKAVSPEDTHTYSNIQT